MLLPILVFSSFLALIVAMKYYYRGYEYDNNAINAVEYFIFKQHSMSVDCFNNLTYDNLRNCKTGLMFLLKSDFFIYLDQKNKISMNMQYLFGTISFKKEYKI